MDLFLFYISEYWLNVLVFIVILAGVGYLAKSDKLSYRDDKQQILVAIVIISYLCLFSGYVGSVTRQFSSFFWNANYQDFKVKGTGSFVSPSVVMTNRHVVDDCKKKIFVRDKKFLYGAEIIKMMDKEKGDVAFLRTSAKREKFALFTFDIPQSGDIIYFPNYTSIPGYFVRSKGKIIESDSHKLRFIAPKGRHGNSGSPIFDAKGRLVGILWGGGGLFMSYAVGTATDEIMKFAQENQVTLYTTQTKNYKPRKETFDEEVVTILCQ